MAEIGVEAVTELIKTVGPTDEQRQKFGRTSLGTLFGQTILLTGMLVIYIGLIVVLYAYGRQTLLDLWNDLGAVWFSIFIGVPLGCILLFSMLPAAARAVRAQRLKTATIRGSPEFKPGYFRLYPYSAADRASFMRLDGACVEILKWLKSSKTSLLYMSGASGVGKSSLLSAKILPSLRDEGWAVVETRVFGDPVEQLRNAPIAVDDLSRKKTIGNAALRELFKHTAAARVKANAPPLLVVIDQFEEFLILHNEVERGPFIEFLKQLAADPIEGVRVLIVFRSDYRPLVFKLELPPLIANTNWKEVSPYDRGEATKFLQGGGRKLTPEGLGRLLNGLDRIEEARGIYRPITLNMVGLVLERMGPRLEGDPARLIQSYLMTALTESESHDFAKTLLVRMITDAGTKEPRTEQSLIVLTGLMPWQVKATLADLSEKGLVRCLEGPSQAWEISHDFLARILGQMIGRLKPTFLQRARPIVAPTVLLGWILAGLLLLDFSLTREEAAYAALVALQGSIAQSEEDYTGRVVQIPSFLSQEDFASLGRHLGALTDLAILDLSNSSNITSLQPLQGLTRLKSLDLSSSSKLTSLEPLRGLTGLESLDLSQVPNLTNLEPLKGLTSLRYLDLTGNSNLADLSPLQGLTQLTGLLPVSRTPS